MHGGAGQPDFIFKWFDFFDFFWNEHVLCFPFLYRMVFLSCTYKLISIVSELERASPFTDPVYKKPPPMS